MTTHQPARVVTPATAADHADDKELRRLVEAATPGPWFASQCPHAPAADWSVCSQHGECTHEPIDGPHCHECVVFDGLRGPDALFIAAARNALPGVLGRLTDAEARVRKLEAERDKLAKFKAWVHDFLDAHSVPYHPPGTHGAAGCRIGDRMDWLMDKLKTAEAGPAITP